MQSDQSAKHLPVWPDYWDAYAGENDDFIGIHRGLLKNNAAAAAGGGSGSQSDELNINSDMYDIYNNRTQNEYCNSINDIITKEHMKSGPLLNKCKNF